MKAKELILFESKILNETYSQSRNFGRFLVEKELNPEEIVQLFSNIQKNLDFGGQNRTMVGRGIDSWNNFKSAIQNSAPVTGFDEKFANLQNRILQATGGKDAPIAQALLQYKAFAKAHPVMQNAIYTGLITLVGIAAGVAASPAVPGAVGAVGAAAGGLAVHSAILGGIKVMDQLLMGDKASSALYKGFKTFVNAYGVGKLSQYIASKISASGNDTPTFKGQGTFSADAPTNDIPTFSPQGTFSANAPIGDSIDRNNKNKINEYIDKETTIQNWFLNEGISSGASRSVWVYESAVPVIFQQIEEANFVQGLKNIGSSIGKNISSAYNASASKLNTIGGNITNKITADKLNTAWKKSIFNKGGGSVDSENVAKFLKQIGVDDRTIIIAFAHMKIPYPFNQNSPKTTSTSENKNNSDINRIFNEASSPAQQAAIAINMKKRGKKPKHDESVMEADKTDTVSLDIPLLLRMMEYAREDAKTDEDLHDVAEKMIELSKHHDYLCMDNYNEIVGSAAHDDVEESNAFTDARMNAIKAGKKSFNVGGKTYPVTGDTSDELEAVEESCPHCGGLMYEASLMNEKKDACYYKVKSRYKVWPSAYASGALVKCRKAGAKNWGNKSK